MQNSYPCTSCRDGRCVTHSVLRFLAYPGPMPRMPEDDKLAVICCEESEHKRFPAVWRFCPFCGAKRT